MFALYYIALFLGISFSDVNCFCDYDWIAYKDNKCIKVFDFLTPYEEAEVFCNIGFNASLLAVDTQEEQRYLTFYLLRLLNLRNNLWLKKNANNGYKNLIWYPNVWYATSSLCSVMLSISGSLNQSLNVGKLEPKSCDGLYGFACQRVKVIANVTVNETKAINIDKYYSNRVLNSNNINTSLVTGIYYKFVNKMHKSFSLTHFGNELCSHRRINDCNRYYEDNSVSIEAHSNTFIFIEHNGAYRIKEKNTLKELVVYNSNVVRLFICLNESRQDFCDRNYEKTQLSYLWKIEKINGTNFYQIRDYPLNRYALGLSYHWEPQYGVNMTSLGLYKYRENHTPNNNTLWRFDFDDLKLNGELYDIELTDNIDTLITKHTTQVDLIETVSVINDSPANLDHKVSVEKSFTESFSTSFGESQRYLDLFTLRNEKNEQLSKSSSQSSSVSDSLGEAASKSISKSLAQAKSLSESASVSQSVWQTKSASDTQSNTKSSTNSNSFSDTNSNTIGVSASTGFSFWGFSASVTASSESTESHTAERSFSETNENTRTHTNEVSNSQSLEHSRTHEQSISDTVSQEFSLNSQQTRDRTNQKSSDQTVSKSDTQTSGNEESKQKETAYDKRRDYSNTTTHTYVIDKTIQVPPFSAIKISSFINWVQDLKFSYNILLRFSATALRRNKQGSNEWSTLESDAVKLILEKSGFPGEIYDQNDDYVYVKVYSNFKGSFGIESYFVAKEIDRSK